MDSGNSVKTALLLSGGMDSLSIAWWKRPSCAFTVSYGQHAAEAEATASKYICSRLKIEHIHLTIDCSSIGSGDLAGTPSIGYAPASDWWPYRNQLLITLCSMKALSLGITKLFIGTVKSDAQHKDGTPQFVHLINSLMNQQEGGMVIEAPAINMTTAELVKTAGVPLEFLSWAHSCHKSNVPCNNCRGCNKYRETFTLLRNEMD